MSIGDRITGRPHWQKDTSYFDRMMIHILFCQPSVLTWSSVVIISLITISVTLVLSSILQTTYLWFSKNRFCKKRSFAIKTSCGKVFQWVRKLTVSCVMRPHLNIACNTCKQPWFILTANTVLFSSVVVWSTRERLLKNSFKATQRCM